MRGVAALLATALAAACSRGSATADAPPAARTFPEGTVLLVDGVALAAAEVEALADGVALLFPEYSRLHARRLALTNELLPRLAGRSLEPARWEEARAACAASEPRAEGARRYQGNFGLLGLGLWDTARRLEPGTWSAPCEIFGRFARVRLEGRDGNPDARAEELDISLLEFPYLDAAEAKDAYERALDRAVLEIVDPAWREAVPEAWQHRMRADNP